MSGSSDRRQGLARPRLETRRFRRRAGAGLTPSERRLLLVMVDLILVNACLLVAVQLWLPFPLANILVLASSGKWFVTLTLLWLLFGSLFGVYDLLRASSITTGVRNSLAASLMVPLVYRFIPWLTPPAEPRMISFSLVALMGISIPAWRALYAQVLLQPIFKRRAMVVGEGAIARRLVPVRDEALELDGHRALRGSGYEIVATIQDVPVADEKTLDPAHGLLCMIWSHSVDEVLVSDSAELSPALQEALLDCRELGVRVTPLSLAYERLTSRIPVEYVERNLMLMVGGGDSAGERLYWLAKRLGDVCLALAAIILMLLLMPFIALGNILGSPGPLFYRQHRVGRGGSTFAILKFRSMVRDAETSGAIWAEIDDPRVTPLGRWLRRTRFDELPQAINVLRGEMSVVGPRPERPEMTGEISRSLPVYRARHAMRPGITGWAQINYSYGRSVEDARTKLEYDLYYIKHASLVLDLLILIRTLRLMVRAEGT